MDDTHARLELGGLFGAVMGILAILISIFNHNIGLAAWKDNWGSEISFRV